VYEAIGVFFIILFRHFKVDPGNNINNGLNSNIFNVAKPSVLKFFFFVISRNEVGFLLTASIVLIIIFNKKRFFTAKAFVIVIFFF